MSHPSSLDNFSDHNDTRRHQGSSDFTPKSDYAPPFLNNIENRHSSKLEKFFKISSPNGPSRRYSELLDPKLNHQNLETTSEKSPLRKRKDVFEGYDQILDPLSQKGLVNLLKGMQKRIEDLGILKSRSKGATSLALIRTNLKMRRKSDVSKWSGGICHREQTTSFLNYEYMPAIAFFDSTVKKESPSPFLKSVVDTMISLRHKNMENSLSPEKKASREHENENYSSTITIVAPELSLKTCHIKDTTVLALEDQVSAKKSQVKNVENIKDLLRMMGFGTNLGLKTRIVIVDIEKLKEISSDSITNIHSPCKIIDLPSQRGGTSRSELTKGMSDPTNPKSPIELKLSPKTNSRQKKLFVFDHSKYMSPSIETSGYLSTGVSQDGLAFIKDKGEEKRALKNVRIHTLTQKKLATLVGSPKHEKTKNGTDFKQKRIATDIDAHVNEEEDLQRKKKPKRRMNPRRTFHASSKLDTTKSLSIHHIYNNNNIKQAPPPQPKVKRMKEVVVEEAKHFGQRRLFLSNTYATGLLSPKLSPKRMASPL